MRYSTIQHTPGYSIIAAIMMIGFLLILTTSTLNLVLQEMQDGKGRQDYMKAYGAAEGAIELALYRIKEYGYGYDYDIDNVEVLGSEIKNAKVSYDFDSRVSDYSGTLQAYETDIIPLFWIDEAGVYFESSEVSLIDADASIVWNILGESLGLSGTGPFSYLDTVGYKTLSSYDYTQIGDFISNPGHDYLIVYNSSSTPQDYYVEVQSGEDFTKPEAIIYGSAKVGKYTQNIKTTVDNAEFLGILKYSIYSGN